MSTSSYVTENLKTAVVTGRHPFDVIGFHALFRSMPELDCYIQHLEDYVSTPREVREQYEAVVFYNMHRETPGQETDWWETGTTEAVEQLGETDQGIVVLHHALLAFPRWPLWSQIVGMDDREIFGYDMGQELRVQVEKSDHPITRSLNDWEMTDETYAMHNAGEGNEILLTVDHPKSMKTLAWTRQHRKSRVFCYQSGHDNQAYANPSFREVLRRGILWSAARI